MAQTLTQAEFLAVVQQTSPGSLNIWYTYDQPLQILGLTIPVLDNSGINQQSQIIQSSQVVFTAGTQTFTLQISNPVLLQGVGDVQFIFFEVTQQSIITQQPLNDIYPDTSTILLPGISSIQFTNSNFDVLINNVEVPRTSLYIQESDRYKSNTQEILAPLNINQLRQDSAAKATVQDSNYEINGWTQARYEGVITNRYNYANVEAGVTGFEIQAALYPIGTLTSYINQQRSGSDQIYSPFLSSRESLERIKGVNQHTGYEITTQITNEVQFDIDFSGSFVGTRRVPAQGDLVSTSEFIQANEISDIKIIQITQLQGTAQTVILNKPITALSGNALYIRNLAQIYQIDGNRAQPAQAGLLAVEGLNDTLRIDESGFVIATIT
jgi:hypothetical protein